MIYGTGDIEQGRVLLYTIYIRMTSLLNDRFFGLLSESQVWLDSTESREQFLCLLIVNRIVNDDIVPLLLVSLLFYRGE